MKRTINVFVIIVGSLLAVYALTMVFTLIWGLNTSLKHASDFGPERNVLGLPNLEIWKKAAEFYQTDLHLFSNYVNVVENLNIPGEGDAYYTMWGELVDHSKPNNLFDLIWNTISYAIFSAVLQAFIPCYMGYLCAKYPNKFSDILYTFLLVIMMIPIVGAYSAEIVLLKALGLHDTLIGNLIQKSSFTGIYFFIFYAYFKGVPDSYIEAAEVDGASQFRVMFTIMMPLAIKTISTVALLRFVGFWNDYNVAVLYLPSRPTLAFAVYYLSVRGGGNNFSSIPSRVAACMFLALPVLIIFVVLKDKLMGNVSMGGVKG